jgi:hypothetical protein
VKGQRWRWQAKALANGACGQAARAGLHQDSEDIQPRLLGEGGQPSEHRFLFHSSIFIELLKKVKPAA